MNDLERERLALCRDLEAKAMQALARRGMDPEQAVREGVREGTSRVFARYVAECHPSLRFRRLMAQSVLAAFGRLPLRYLRPIDYLGATMYLQRRWRRKFQARFLAFWDWAAQREPAQPLEEFVVELAAMALPPARDVARTAATRAVAPPGRMARD
ncbi:hypothetical protein H8N03_06715 [Ramlibacter sp. USB13]|uniref:Uncharacterized protein n=1 Tax=Ramlibacter cellulosilyticus TaxID=2764187 RepID=A0A923MPP9_9BURK|nr:hypothetical protein [Ramlibacter cellulosilyticus]MBC5782631.1 hypothetical protein [Ramlibacter cellulosilyticus]